MARALLEQALASIDDPRQQANSRRDPDDSTVRHSATLRLLRATPFSEAWSSTNAHAYLEQRAGIEFDPDRVAAFIKMLREGGTKVSAV